MKFKKWLLTSVAILIPLALVGCKEEASNETENPNDTPRLQEEAKVIRFAHFQPGTMDQPKQAAALAFEAYVEKNSNGSLDIQIYPASQLGDEKTILENLKMNTVQMTAIHDGPVSSIYAPMGVYNLPYLFENPGEAWSIFDSDFTKEIGEAMLAETDIRLLGMADNGVRNFTNNKKEIKSVQDMKDLKMRVQPGPLFEKLVSATGASPSVIPWPELPTALQQGVVDGQENGVTNILAASLYESQKYATLDGHIYSYHAYLMSDKFYETLSDEEKKIIQEGVDIAKWVHRGMTANQDMNAGAILASKGMEVTTLTSEQIDEFRQATQPAVAEWLRDEAGSKWVDGILKEVENLRVGQ